jgi:hypothetical protein
LVGTLCRDLLDTGLARTVRVAAQLPRHWRTAASPIAAGIHQSEITIPESAPRAGSGQPVNLVYVNGCGLRSNYCSARRRLQEGGTVLNDTWCSRDLPVLTAIAEKLERGSAPVDTEQVIDELGLTRQDLMAALHALDVEYLIVRWPERITYRRSDPSTLVERITSRAREAVGLWPSTEARQPAQPRPGHDQK